MRSGLIENELVLPEMKSDRTQKNVTVYNSQYGFCSQTRNNTYRQGDIKVVVLRAEMVEGINKYQKTRARKRGEEVRAYELQ